MNKISFYRKQAGYTQRELAKVLSDTFSVNFSNSAIAQYETGERTPSLIKAKMIADFFSVTIEEIFFSDCAHESRIDK